VPVAAAAPGEGEVEAGTLPGGPVAVAVHGGPYDQLNETYAALERWIETHGYRVNGAPWEAYITDPADLPDPADWRTEVCWPLEK
jgi:AraC family transcriptional regulator